MDALFSLAAFLAGPAILEAYRRVRGVPATATAGGGVDIAAIASALGVVPHPEGGYFIETYRSGSVPMASKGLTATDGSILTTAREGSARNVMTSMIFMASAQARVLYFGVNMSDHVHYYHGGDSYTYIVVHPDGSAEELVLGRDVSGGEKLQIVFPAGCFKAGYLNGEYCLIGEGVAPGFDFRDFQFVDEDMLRKVLTSGADLQKYLCFVKPDRRRNFNDYYANK